MLVKNVDIEMCMPVLIWPVDWSSKIVDNEFLILFPVALQSTESALHYLCSGEGAETV